MMIMRDHKDWTLEEIQWDYVMNVHTIFSMEGVKLLKIPIMK